MKACNHCPPQMTDGAWHHLRYAPISCTTYYVVRGVGNIVITYIRGSVYFILNNSNKNSENVPQGSASRADIVVLFVKKVCVCVLLVSAKVLAAARRVCRSDVVIVRLRARRSGCRGEWRVIHTAATGVYIIAEPLVPRASH